MIPVGCVPGRDPLSVGGDGLGVSTLLLHVRQQACGGPGRPVREPGRLSGFTVGKTTRQIVVVGGCHHRIVSSASKQKSSADRNPRLSLYRRRARPAPFPAVEDSPGSNTGTVNHDPAVAASSDGMERLVVSEQIQRETKYDAAQGFVLPDLSGFVPVGGRLELAALRWIVCTSTPNPMICSAMG